MDCPICGDTGPYIDIEAQCIFSKKELIRHECQNCGVIFGTEWMIELPEDKLREAYIRLYKVYKEKPTDHETRAFKLVATNGDRCLLYGCGANHKLLGDLNESGYDTVGYDWIAGDEEKTVNTLSDFEPAEFDVIVSNNVIEHFQDPIAAFKEMNRLLKPGGKMAHATACYQYRYGFTRFHTFFFLGISLQILCEATGFEICGHEEDEGEFEAYIMRKINEATG